MPNPLACLWFSIFYLVGVWGFEPQASSSRILKCVLSAFGSLCLLLSQGLILQALQAFLLFLSLSAFFSACVPFEPKSVPSVYHLCVADDGHLRLALLACCHLLGKPSIHYIGRFILSLPECVCIYLPCCGCIRMA